MYNRILSLSLSPEVGQGIGYAQWEIRLDSLIVFNISDSNKSIGRLFFYVYYVSHRIFFAMAIQANLAVLSTVLLFNFERQSKII